MIKVPINLFYRKIRFAANLARDLFPFRVFSVFILFSQSSTWITKILFNIRNSMHSIARKMKTCVAHVAIKNLIGIIIKTTKTNFTVSLKILFVSTLMSLGWFNKLVIFKKLLKHILSFVPCSMFKIPQNRMMHQLLINLKSLVCIV